MLFDLFEEQLDLPALFVDLCDGERGKGEVVGQKLQLLAGFGIAIGDAAQLLWVRRGRLERGKNHRLIRVHARASVYRARGAAFVHDVAFAARHEEGRAERELVESLKIDIGAVIDIVGSGLGFDPVERM